MRTLLQSRFVLNCMTIILAMQVFSTTTFAQAPPPGPIGKQSPPAVRRVYVPVEDLDVVISRDKRGVLLPRDEFTTLYNTAEANRRRTLKIPAAIVVSSASYRARIIDDQLLISAEINFTQFADGWQSIALPFQGLALEKATIANRPARLGRQQKTGILTLLNDKPGKQTISIELSTVLTAVGSDKVATFNFVPIPSAELAVNLPAGKHLLVGGLAVERPAPVDQQATYTIAVGGQQNIRLRITDRETERSTDRLLFATTAHGLNVAPGEVTWRAITSLAIYGSQLDRLIFSVPNTLEIADVESTGLESWELADDPNNKNITVITLNYRQPFDGIRKIVFQGVMTTAADGTWRVPTLTLNNVTSHVGRVIIRHPLGVRLRTIEAVGARHATVRAQPAATDDPFAAPQVSQTQQQFDVWLENFSLAFITQPKERELQVGLTTVLDINDAGLDLQMVAGIQTYFAPLFQLDVLLPADWTVTAATLSHSGGGVNNPKIKNPKSEIRNRVEWQLIPGVAGTHHVRIAFNPPLKPGQSAQLNLTAHRDLESWPVENEPVEFEMPEVRLPQTAVLEGTYVILADEDLDIVPVEISGLDPAKIDAPGTRLGFTYQDTRFTGKLRVSRKPTRIAARTLSFTRLEQQTLHTHLEARLEVEGGGLRALQVSLSESAGTDLRFFLLQTSTTPSNQQQAFYPVRIVEQTSLDPVDGQRTWMLRLDRRVKGELLLSVDVASPRDEAEQFQPHLLLVTSADRQNGFIAIEAASDQKLDISAVAADGITLADVDPVDIPPAFYVPKERIVAAYRYISPGYRVTMTETRFDRLAVPTAICHHSHVESVLGQTGEFQHRATFLFVAVGVQSLQIQLPANEHGRLWATLIDGQPVEVRNNGNAYLVPLPSSDTPDAQHTLQLFYETRIPPLKTTGRLKQQPPQLSVISGDGKNQPVEILDQSWTVHYPRETQFIHSLGPFTPERELDRSSILGRFQQSFKVGSPTELLWNLAYVAAAAGVIFLFTLGYRRFGLRGLVSSGAALGVIGIGISFVFYSFAKQESSNARYYSAKTAATADYASASGAAFDDERFAPAAGNDMPAAQRSAGEKSELESDLRRQVVVAKKTATIEAAKNPNRAKPQLATTRPPNAPTADMKPREANRDADEKKHIAEKLSAEITGLSKGNDRLRAKLDAATKVEFDRRSGINGQSKDRKEEEFLSTLEQVDLAHSPFDDSSKGRGLLSLALNLVAPDNNLTHKFRYVGTDTAETGIGLDIRYENRIAGTSLRLALVTGVMLVFWLLRHRSARIKAPLGTAGVALPLALVAIAPVSWHVAIDGLFLGSMGGLFLWSLCATAAALSCCCPRIAAKFGNCSLGRTTALLLAATIISASVTDVFAQKKPTPPTKGKQAVRRAPVAAPTRNMTKKRSTNAGRQATNNSATLHNVPTVVVPYDPDGDPLAAERVFLPHKQFVELWNRAYPEKKIIRPAPVDALIAEALYVAQLKPTVNRETGIVAVTARLVLYSFRDRQVKLPLPLGQVALRSAKLDGQPAPVTTRAIKGGSRLDIVLESVGSHVLDLEFDLPVELTGPAGQFTLPLSPVPSGKLSFTLPAKELAVRVNGSNSIYRRRQDGERETIEIPIDRGGNMTVAWQPKLAKAAVDAIIHANSATAVTFNDAGIRISSGWQLNVPRGSFADLSFKLPATLQLQRITGQDVGGWEIAGEGDTRTVRVFFRRSIEDQTRLTFDLFYDTKIDDAVTVEIPDFGPNNVTRDIGLIAVFAGPQFSVRGGQVTGLLQINADQFKTDLKIYRLSIQPLLSYRYTAHPWKLPLVVSRRQPESTGVSRHAVIVERRKIRISSRIEFNLTEAPRSSVSIRLPSGYLPIEVNATDLGDWYVSRDDNSVLTIELTGPRTGRVEVVLLGTIIKEPDDTLTDAVVPYPLAISRLTTWVGISLDEAYSATLSEAEGWRPITPAELPGDLRNQHRIPVQFAFISSKPKPEPVSLDITRATPQLTADVVTMLTVTDTVLNYALAFQWRITQAAADRFVFTTPDWLAGRLEIKGAGIRQVLQVAAGEGRTRWTVILQEPVRNAYVLDAQAWLAPPVDNKVRSPLVTFEQATDDEKGFATLETQRQFVLLINQSRAQLTPDNPEVVEPVQAEDLPIEGSEQLVNQAVAVVQQRKGRAAPVWTAKKFEQQQGAPASVNLADLLLVVAKDGTWRGRAIYTIKNRARQFLAVQIPAESRLLSVFVQGRPSRAVETTLKKQQTHLIALPKTSAADLSFEVKVVFSGRLPSLPEGVRAMAQQFDLPAPHVLTMRESPEYGIPVARTVWTVYLPKDLDASAIDDPNRNNLTDATAEKIGLFYRMAQLKEATQLLNVAKSADSYGQRTQAMRNLKQLNPSLKNYRQPSPRSGEPQEDDEEYGKFYALNNDLQQKLGEHQRQQADKEANGRDDLRGVADELLPFDEAAQKDRIDFNYSLLARGNSVAVQVQTKDDSKSMDVTEEQFGYKLKFNASKPTSATFNKSKRGKKESRKPLYYRERTVVDNRKLLRKKALSQLGIANEALVEQKAAQQAPNQPARSVTIEQQLTESNREQTGFDFEVGARQRKSIYTLRGSVPIGQPGPPYVDSIVNMGDADGLTPSFFGKIPTGGFGGGGQVDGDAIGHQIPAGWTAVGGLSLDINVPQDGQQLTFSKIGGQPKLAIAIRPRRSLEVGFGLVWTIVWLVIGVTTAIALSRPGSARVIRRNLPKVMIALGLVGFFLLPGGWVWTGFALFLLGSTAFAFQHRHAS